jgi:hypothetical protein
MGGGMLYVEPIYVQGTASSQFPLGRAIVVAFGNKLAWSNTLDGALNELFGGAVVVPPSSGPTTPTPTPSPTTGPTTPLGGALAQAIADAQKAFADGEAALKAGDFAAYGGGAEAAQGRPRPRCRGFPNRVPDRHPGADRVGLSHAAPVCRPLTLSGRHTVAWGGRAAVREAALDTRFGSAATLA